MELKRRIIALKKTDIPEPDFDQYEDRESRIKAVYEHNKKAFESEEFIESFKKALPNRELRMLSHHSLCTSKLTDEEVKLVEGITQVSYVVNDSNCISTLKK